MKSVKPVFAEGSRPTEKLSVLQLDAGPEKRLNELLASHVVLYYKVKKAHWGAAGPWFKEVHEFLDEIAKFVIQGIDEIAERIVMLGGEPLGGLEEFGGHTQVRDFPPGPLIIKDALATLLEDHERMIFFLREMIAAFDDRNDPGTADLLTALVRDYEKSAWFLRKTLEQAEVA